VSAGQTVLSGDVYTTLSFLIDMMDVSLELVEKPKASGQELSLARYVHAPCHVPSGERKVNDPHIKRNICPG
jgi:hypothetical protein